MVALDNASPGQFGQQMRATAARWAADPAARASDIAAHPIAASIGRGIGNVAAGVSRAAQAMSNDSGGSGNGGNDNDAPASSEEPAEPEKDLYTTPAQKLQFAVNNLGHPDNAKNGLSANPNYEAFQAHMKGQQDIADNPAPHPLASIMNGQTGSQPAQAPAQQQRTIGTGVAARARALGRVSTTPAPMYSGPAGDLSNANPRGFIDRSQGGTLPTGGTAKPRDPLTYSGGGITQAMSDKQRSQIWAAGKGGRGTVNGIGATTQAVNSVTPQPYGE